MPELPEVEIARRNLKRWMARRRVVKAEAENTRVFRGATPKDFEAIHGKLERISRRGKYLMLTFEDGRGLLAHLGMTGKFVKRKPGELVTHSRARFVLDSGTVIHFQDPRLFGRMEPVAAEQLAQLKPIAQLGRDPLEDGLTPAQLKAALIDSKQDVKVALMDQSRIAGLGNIHAAEALYRAHLHPARKPKSLKEAEWRALAKAIHQTIAFALENEEADEIEYVEEPGAQNPFLIYGRAGEACRRCGKKVVSFTQGGRTTHACPGCQPRRG